MVLRRLETLTPSTDTRLVESNDHPFPRCGLPSETVHLPTVNTSLQISFAHCRPSKSSLKTLQASGAMLGLAASTSLSQTKTPSLLKQLVEKGMIERDIWSLLLINGREGVFSVGGTAAEAVEMVDRETREELDKIGELERQAAQVSSAQEKVKRDLTKKGKALELKRGLENWSASWKWSKVQGADGWWQILMQGVWTDGSRVLKNQPVILDVRPSQLSHDMNSLMTCKDTNICTVPAKHTFHPSTPSSSKDILLLNLRLQATVSSLRPILRLPLPEPTNARIRIRRLEVPGPPRRQGR